MSTTTIAQRNWTGSQVAALKELISLKSDVDELRMLIREVFDQQSGNMVNMSGPFPTVVFNLIEKLERDGLLLELVEALIQRKPNLKTNLEAIRDGVETQQPTSYDPVQLREFRNEFHHRLAGLEYLNAYKGLHEVLHNLSGIVPQIEEEAAARVKDGTPIPEPTTEDLWKWADESECLAAKTENPDSGQVSVWIPRFRSAVHDLLGNEVTKHAKALAIITQVPSQLLNPLNQELVACAQRLKIGELVDLLDKLPVTLLNLTHAVASFRDPCVRLQALIRDHDICQKIDTELRVAATLPSVSPDTLLGWDDVQKWITELVTCRPGDSRVTRTRQAADAFVRAPSADTFRSIIEKFLDLFKKTDEALLRVTGPLSLAAFALADALEKVR